MDKSELDISFEELKENDHLRIQKRQLGVAAVEAEKDSQPNARVDTSHSASGHASTKGHTTFGSTSPSINKHEKAKEPTYTKKPLFDSDLVQLDLFSPFPIEFFNSCYLQKALKRIKFAENKINYMKPKFVSLCKMNLIK